MEIRVCPECGKAFYSLSDTESLICRYCGFVIFDRRTRGRVKAPFDFKLKLSGHEAPARLKDYSETGARIVFKGRLLSKSTVISLVIDELGIERTAKTMWSKRVGRGTYSYGLQLYLDNNCSLNNRRKGCK